MSINPYLSLKDKIRLKKYYKSDHWQQFRELVVDMAGGFCQKCSKFKGRRLQVHHLSYENLYNEGLEEVIALCKKCHKLANKAKNGFIDNETADYLDIISVYTTR